MTRFSVSEIQSYLRCRRAWDLTSQNRKGLVKIGITPAPLQMGSALHAAFDAQASGEEPLDAVETYFREEEARIQKEYTTIVGMAPHAEEMNQFHEVAANAYNLAYRYFEHYGWENPLGADYRYVQTEVTFEVPIPGTNNKLIGTFDGIAEHVPSKSYWLVEHKTYTMPPREDKLSTDWQLSCYLWAAEILFGKPLRGVLYDGIAKKTPKVPNLLVSGKLSKAQNVLAGTDAASYREAIQEYELDEADYSDVLSQLEIRDQASQTPFYTRWRVDMPRQVLLETERTLRSVTREMASPKTEIIPNFPWEGCPMCNVRDLCKAIQFGDDVEWLIKNHYRRGEGHATVKRMSRPRRVVESVADLERQTSSKKATIIKSGRGDLR
jgi:hypothetical protein